MIITEQQFIRDNLKTLGKGPLSSSFNRRHNYHNKEDDQDHPQLHRHHRHSLLVPKELNLSFQGLEQIENFMNGFGRITTLLLNNNKIQEICSLHDLVHLEKLDLSFNDIRTIKGLDSLINLTRLSLFHNKIVKIEGLSRCTSLQSISLGANAITSSSLTATSSTSHCTYSDETSEPLPPDVINSNCGILHLKSLVYLRDCNFSGNPITSEDGYKQKVLSHLPQLEYLDNARVMKSDERIDFQTATKAGQDLDHMNILISPEDHSHANTDIARMDKKWDKKCATIATVVYDEDLPMIVSQLQSNLNHHHQEFMKKEEELKTAIQNICHDLDRINEKISLLMTSNGDGDVDLILEKIKIQCDVIGHQHMEDIEQMLYDAANHRDFNMPHKTQHPESEIRPSDKGGGHDGTVAINTVTDRMMKAELQVPTNVDVILTNGARRIKEIMDKIFAFETNENSEEESSSSSYSSSQGVENLRQKCREVHELVKMIEEEETDANGGADRGERLDLTYYATLEERVNEALLRMKDNIEDKTNSKVQTLREEALRWHRQRVGEIASISLPK